MAKKVNPSRAKELFQKYGTWLLLVPVLVVCMVVVLNAQYFALHAEYLMNPPEASGGTPDDDGSSGQASAPIGPNRIVVPSLGIDAPLNYVTSKGEGVYQDALMKGAVHYPGTAMPGEYGNVYIFGHSSDLAWKKNPYATVFALLTQIETGAEIIVAGPDGVAHTYIAEETRIVNPSETSVLSQRDYKEKVLTLQTSYPLGTALQRFLVIARLQE